MGNVQTPQKRKTCPRYYTNEKALNNITRSFHYTPYLTHILSGMNSKWKHTFRFYENTIDISRARNETQVSYSDLQDMATELVRGINVHKWKVLNNLEFFPFRAENCILNKTEEVLNPQISNVVSLKSLTLRLWCQNVSDQDLKRVGCRISHNFSKLKQLSIGFEHCQRVTDKGVIAFVKEMTKNLYDLRELSVTFSNFHKLTDRGFITFISYISRKLVNLQSLTLVFIQCIEITNQSTEALIVEIKRHLTKLKKLELQFLSPCKQLKLYCQDIRHLQEKLSFIPKLILQIN